MSQTSERFPTVVISVVGMIVVPIVTGFLGTAIGFCALSIQEYTASLSARQDEYLARYYSQQHKRDEERIKWEREQRKMQQEAAERASWPPPPSGEPPSATYATPVSYSTETPTAATSTDTNERVVVKPAKRRIFRRR